jgi:hypothetical protein
MAKFSLTTKLMEQKTPAMPLESAIRRNELFNAARSVPKTKQKQALHSKQQIVFSSGLRALSKFCPALLLT